MDEFTHGGIMRDLLDKFDRDYEPPDTQMCHQYTLGSQNTNKQKSSDTPTSDESESHFITLSCG